MMSKDTFVNDFPAKPSLYCVGVVTEVGNGHLSDSQHYMVIPIKISAKDAGKDTTVNFLYQPNWFTKNFNTILNLRSFKEEFMTEKGNLGGAAWVYSTYINNISDNEKAVSMLRGLCGSFAKFEELSNALLNLPVPEGSDGPSVDDVTETLRDFLENNMDQNGEHMLIGYVLEQESKRTNEVNPETGKTVYVRTKRYIIPTPTFDTARYNKVTFWDVTRKNITHFTNDAEKSEIKDKATGEGTGEFYRKMTFTELVPF